MRINDCKIISETIYPEKMHSGRDYYVDIESLGNDNTSEIVDAVSRRVETMRSIQATRDSLPTMGDAMRDYTLFAWVSRNAWTGITWYLELGNDGRYYIDPHMFNDEEPWCIRGRDTGEVYCA